MSSEVGLAGRVGRPLALDWPTVRAVALYFDVDPHDVKCSLELGKHGSNDTNWCQMPVNRWHRDMCSRTARATVMGLRVCYQHENVLVTGLHSWVQDAAVGDLLSLMEALHWRLNDQGADVDPEATVRLRSLLAEFLGEQNTLTVAGALTKVWGDESA